MIFLRSLPLALALLLMAIPTWAEVFYDLTFESADHAVGQPPPIGARPSKVSSIIFGSPRIVNTQPLLDGKCLEFEGYTGYEQIYLHMGAASGMIQVDFDIVTENLIGSLYGFTVLLDTPIVRNLTFHGPQQQIQALMPFGGGTLQGFVDGRKYHVTIVADTIANLWRISIDGVARYESALSAIVVSSIRLSMAPAYAMAADSPQTKAYVDNFKVTNYPPSGSAPLVDGVTAAEVKPHQAFLSANVNPQGLATNVYFRYWKQGQIGNFTATRTLAPSSNFSTVTEQVRLEPHSVYSVAAYVVNAAGTAVAESSFTSGNNPPIAPDVSLHSPSGTEPFTLLGPLGTDWDGDPVSFQLVPPGEEGYDSRVTVAGGSLIFSPDAGYDGNVEVKYDANDGFGGVARGIVKVTNAAPVARNLTVHAPTNGQPAQITPPLLDADGDEIAITAVGEASFGQASFDGGLVTYFPGLDFAGSDEFSYTVSDGRGGKATATIYVRLTAVQQTLLHGTGSAVPGVPGAVWRSFGVPSLFAPGHAGWAGKIREGSAIYGVIVSGPLGHPQVRLRTGDSATNGSGAAIPVAVFESFAQPVFAGENFAFKARLAGPDMTPENSNGIWVSDSGTARLIARESFPAGGANGAPIRALESLAMPNSKSAFFTATLADGTRGLWAWTAETGVQRVLAEGQMITRADNGGSLGRVSSFQSICHVPGSSGHGRYDGSRQAVDALVRLQNGRSALLSVDALGGITVVERTSDRLETPRPTVKLGRGSSPGNGRKPVAVAEFAITYPAMERHRGVVDFETGAVVALAGSSAPGPGAERFLAFRDPVAGLTSTGGTLVAFVATLGGAPAGTAQGIWRAASGKLALVARKGDAAPGVDGMRFRQFKSLSVIDGHGPMFTASLSPGNQTGFWATDTLGNLQLLARTGTEIEGKEIRAFDVLTAVPGSEGQRRAWLETAHGTLVLYRVRFADGTQGLVSSSVP